jgi:hypothetical protein
MARRHVRGPEGDLRLSGLARERPTARGFGPAPAPN